MSFSLYPRPYFYSFPAASGFIVVFLPWTPAFSVCVSLCLPDPCAFLPQSSICFVLIHVPYNVSSSQISPPLLISVSQAPAPPSEPRLSFLLNQGLRGLPQLHKKELPMPPYFSSLRQQLLWLLVLSWGTPCGLLKGRGNLKRGSESLSFRQAPGEESCLLRS